MYTKKNYKHAIIASLFALSTPLFTNESAVAVHPHCAVIPFTAPTVSMPWTISDNPTSNRFFEVNSDDIIGFPVISVSPANTIPPDCNYEVSDITLFKVTFFLEDDNQQVSFSNFSLIGFDANNPNSLTFTDKIPFSIPLTPHQQDGTPIYEFDATDAIVDQLPFFIGWDEDQGESMDTFPVLQVNVEMSGNHYYIKTPEPSAILGLLSFAGLGLLSSRKKVRKSR